MVYNAPFYSMNNVTRAVKRLSFDLRQKFYEFTKVSKLIGSNINLITFKKWF